MPVTQSQKIGDTEKTAETSSAADAASPIASRTRRAIKRLLILLALSPLALVAGFAIFRAESTRRLAAEIAEAKRDAATGVVVGTEAADLGPSDAPAACLMLHGFIGSRIDFGDLPQRLAARGLRVRCVRLPGHGTTPREFAGVKGEELVEAARGDLAALRAKHREVYVAGFSMGGTIATILAAEEKIDRLVLIAPYYEVTSRWYYGLTPEAWNRLLSPIVPYAPKGKAFIQVNREEAKDHLFSYMNVPSSGLRMLIDLGLRAQAPGLAERIQAPTLVLHARGDLAASPAAAERMLARFGAKKKLAIWYPERSNHHLLWDYDGDDAKARALRFLDPGDPNYAETVNE